MLILIGLAPLIFNKYYLTLDGPGHIYNGNIIKELIVGNNQEFSNLFKFNLLPVPNWISHFLFAILNMVFPDYISEKIFIGTYLVLFPLFFRKIVLWFAPQNKAFSCLGLLFAHNHLLYLGSYNLVFALMSFFIVIYFILRWNAKSNLRQTVILSLLFLLVYFSHMLILLVNIAVAIFLPLTLLKVEKTENGVLITNWKEYFSKLKFILIAIIPVFLLSVNYIINVDSLEEAGRLDLRILLNWIIDVRPMLTLCYCAGWIHLTHLLSALFILMLGTYILVSIKNNLSFNDKNLKINIPVPGFSLIWFLFFFIFTILFLIVPNANVLPDRLIILVFIFLAFWLSCLAYPKWLHKIAFLVIVLIHCTFSFWYIDAMKDTSKQVKLIKEVVPFIEKGSLVLPFNFATDFNWLHMHSPGYLGSDKPVAVIENYEGQLKWFPVSWNLESKYNLSPLNVWAADNKKMIGHYYSNPLKQEVFSLPQKDGKIKIIPYIVIIGKMQIESDPDFQKIKSILDSSYKLIFKNDLCLLYKINLKT
ncbi:MAG: hypothetical protein IPH57_01890 [Saprospiraceae bacterium]|nr:hypothetical protein [Saprospiraceae bacterium]